jgi:ribonuclease HI
MITTKYDDAESILDIQPLHHIAFTDGSCYPNNKSKTSLGGYASVFVSGSFNDKCIYGNLDISEYYASNIRAEGIAIIRTLELVRDCAEKWDKLTIVSDCKFWIDMIENYMPKWKKNKFKEMSNPDLTIRMWVVYNEVKKNGEIKLVHMRSHGKDKWQECEDGSYNKFCFDQNDYADKMCGYARTNLKPTEEIFKDITYE